MFLQKANLRISFRISISILLIFIFRSSLVRKQSVQLLTQLLQCNPFDASLCVDTLNERLTEEKAKLTQLTPKDGAEETAKKWVETEKALEAFLKKEETDDKDKVFNTDSNYRS